MGWKNVKEHYAIGHIVQVTKKGICIGSGYVHDLIVVASDGTVSRPRDLGRGAPFDGWVEAMRGDPETLRRLIAEPDRFARSIPVYTYDYDGNIIEKFCEQPGWPNVTHDGQMMFENTFSADRAEVVEWAKRELTAARDQVRARIAERERDLAERRASLAGYEAALVKLGQV